MGPLTRHLSDDEVYDLAFDSADPATREGLFEHVAGCSTCADRLRDAAGEYERARAFVAGRPRAESAPPVSRGVRSRWWIVPLAAAAALAFVFLRPPSDAPSGFWSPVDLEATAARGVPAVDERFADAIQAFEERDAERAIAEFEKLNLAVSVDDPHIVLFANALVNAGRYEDALATLLPIRPQRLPDPWRGRSYWLMYLCHQALAQEDEADEALDRLIWYDGEFADEARAERER